MKVPVEFYPEEVQRFSGATLLNCNSVINIKKWCLKDVKPLMHDDKGRVVQLMAGS